MLGNTKALLGKEEGNITERGRSVTSAFTKCSDGGRKGLRGRELVKEKEEDRNQGNP